MTSSGVDVPAVRPATRAPSNHSGRRSRAPCTRKTRAQWRPQVAQSSRVLLLRGAADDHDHVACRGERLGRLLAQPRRHADGVRHAHLGQREPPANERGEVPHPLDRLRRLRGDAEARPRLQPRHVLFGRDDVEGVEVLGQPAHLHVVRRADDDRVEAVLRERRHRAMRGPDDRAGRVEDVQAAVAHGRAAPLGRAVRRDRHGWRVHLRRPRAEAGCRGPPAARARSRCEPARRGRSAARARRPGGPSRSRRARRSTCPDGSLARLSWHHRLRLGRSRPRRLCNRKVIGQHGHRRPCAGPPVPIGSGFPDDPLEQAPGSR